MLILAARPDTIKGQYQAVKTINPKPNTPKDNSYVTTITVRRGLLGVISINAVENA